MVRVPFKPVLQDIEVYYLNNKTFLSEEWRTMGFFDFLKQLENNFGRLVDERNASEQYVLLLKIGVYACLAADKLKQNSLQSVRPLLPLNGDWFESKRKKTKGQ